MPLNPPTPTVSIANNDKLAVGKLAGIVIAALLGALLIMVLATLACLW